MSQPILFFDVDGVLNGHDYDARARSNTINPRCVDHLNQVIEATDCRLVISSAWRYMIHGNAMSLRGFEYLLRTHRLAVTDRLCGFTRPDTPDEGQAQDPAHRGRQILEWVDAYGDGARWAAVDDLDLSTVLPAGRFLRTDGLRGLTWSDAQQLIRLLRG